MTNLNVCTFSGRAGADGEVKEWGANGCGVFNVAVNLFTPKAEIEADGQRTMWVSCKLWHMPERAEWVRKGDLITVSGELSPEEGSDGKTYINLNVRGLQTAPKPKASGTTDFSRVRKGPGKPQSKLPF